jgi:hypothetical protein
MTTNTVPYDVRVLRHVLESCDWLASRGRDGLRKLQEYARETRYHDGDARHELVPLPAHWSRAIPLHGAVMNGHAASTLPYLVEALGAPVGGVCPRNGNTPCHTAVVWGHLNVVAYLLARGARHDAKNDNGFDLVTLCRRRQERLVSGSEVDRAYYTRNGVPLQALVEEGAKLTRLLEGVARAGGWDAWARPRATRSRVVALAAPWLRANELRRDLAVLRANCKGLEKLEVVPDKPRRRRRERRDKVDKRMSLAGPAAAAAARATVALADLPLPEALETADLAGEQFARALRWLGAATVDDARDLDRTEVARVDGLTSAERRKLWLFVAAAIARRDDAVAAAERAALEDAAEPPPPIRVDAKVALLLLEAMPEGPVSVIARFAYAARCPIIDARPVEDEKILAAVRCMKM